MRAQQGPDAAGPVSIHRKRWNMAPDEGTLMPRISKGTLLAAFIVGLSAHAADKPVPTIIYFGATIIDTETGALKPNVVIVTRGQRMV